MTTGIGPLGELATDGKVIYPNMCAITYGRDGNGNVTTMTLSQYGATYTKTFTYTNGALTGKSLWVAS